MEHGDCIKETKRILGQYNKMKVAVQNLAEEIEARTAALQGESVAIARYGDEPTGGTGELTATEAAAARRMRAAADIAEMEQRKKMRRSVTFARDLPAGHVLARSDLYAKRPGTGIAPDRMGALVGKTLARAVRADTLLCREDILEDLDA